MGITASCFHHLKEVVKRENRECCGRGVAEVIERSKVHWSILKEEEVMEGNEVAEVSNVEEFLALQGHPDWGGFFQTFGYDLGERYNRQGELVVGEKFAEGGQAELYDCKVKWWNVEGNDEDMRKGIEYVLKVFKKGTYLRQLRLQMPQGLLQDLGEGYKNWRSATPIKVPRLACHVIHGTLLEDGRFAFLMQKEHFDLRHLIDEKMKLRSGRDCGPFSKEEIELFMYEVAIGVDWLHRQGIVHRDLKASNVLVTESKDGWLKYICFVADYECSVGVLGTGFFRAPEILQALKDHKLEERPEVFSEAADIYGYGMICYEVLSGKLPFEGYPSYDYVHVLNGQRPVVPKHAGDWIHELLDRCWQSDPAARPPIGEVLSVILAHSEKARRREKGYKSRYGLNYREGYRVGE